MGTTQLDKPAATLTSERERPQPSAGDEQAVSRPFVMRRRYVVDGTSQLRSSISTILIVAGLLAMLNLTLFQMGQISTGAIADYAPELLPAMEDADRSRTAVTLACSLVFLIGFGALRVVESHRTYGAAFNLNRRLSEIANGRYAVSVRLRKDDRLHRVAETVNHVAESLRKRTRDDMESLFVLSARAREIDSLEDARKLSSDIDELIEAKRSSLG